MSLKSIRNRLRSTKCASSAIIPICMMFIVILIIFTNYVYRRQLLSYNNEFIESSLTESLLAGSVINLKEYGDTGNIMIMEKYNPSGNDTYFSNSVAKFRECIQNNMRLDNAWNINSDHGVTGNVTLDEYRVYNYIKDTNGYHIVEMDMVGNSVSVIKHADNSDVYVWANGTTVKIKETSVYARISFDIHLTGHMSWMENVSEDMTTGRYTLTRLVGVTDN